MPVDLTDQVMEGVLPLKTGPPVAGGEKAMLPSYAEGTTSAAGPSPAGWWGYSNAVMTYMHAIRGD
ncbi:UNVERIFIED_CONTAM: hypothetical protein Sangu_1176600 [Sesamum angustifolium]|uniref:Uncharacterized protein n=1 Tax=Sesamum angustifolium TaxID=2727405 RepID=A0AAW2NHI5_9LAMI